jgi:acyl-CoA reductase-like NAD-dependent aldehyde dehydrogenase
MVLRASSVNKRTVTLFWLRDSTEPIHPRLGVSTAWQFQHHFNAGLIGINVGVPAPMAWFPFTGWDSSFFGDLHNQGIESVQFYTNHNMIMSM